MAITNIIHGIYRHYIVRLYRKIQFGKFGYRSIILSPLKIDGGKNITIGNRVIVEKGTWLASVPLTGDKSSLTIGDGCRIGHYNHIYCTQSITIENDVLTADKVYISDNLHTFEDVNTPIWKQPIKQLPDIVIGQGAWLGENVCVIGANIGKGSVIGANSVVTKDIPDYCVAVGAPAKVIKRYNQETRQWEKL